MQGHLDTIQQDDAAAPRSVQFYVLQQAGSVFVMMLATAKWTRFLRERFLGHPGVLGPPDFERAALPSEPETHPNGHAFGWLWRDPWQAILDEKRILCAIDPDLAARSEAALTAAVKRALALVSPAASTPLPIGSPAEVAVSPQ